MLTVALAHAKGLIHAIRETLRQRRERNARFQMALAFNQVHTFTDTRVSCWMCPSCNRIHTALHRTAIDGPVYPACCEHERGGRKDRRFATGLAW